MTEGLVAFGHVYSTEGLHLPMIGQSILAAGLPLSSGQSMRADMLILAMLEGALEFLRVFWPFILILLFLPILRKFLRCWTFDFRNMRLINSARTIKDLLGMDPNQFEHLCRLLFQRQGYRIEVTSATNDGGIDLVGNKDGVRIVAQCKRYSSRSIGRPALQQFYGTFLDNRADHGFFLTTSRFSRSAEQFAENKPITLINGCALARWINRYAAGHVNEGLGPAYPRNEDDHSKDGAIGGLRVEYEAVCATCGRQTSLPFKPVKGKPVYCRECYAARRPRTRR